MKFTLHSAPKTSNQVATVVFIDAGVENYQQLVNGVISAAEVFVLDGAADGIEQIGQVLQQLQDIDAVHIVSHGAPGCLYLGNTQLSLDTFNRYATQLQQLDVANLLLYGCNVAAGDAGEEFVEKLHRLTGANIAASRTPTGNSALGGNWELEVVIGQEQPLLAFQSSVMAAYEGILATTPTLSVSGKTKYNGDQVAVAPALTITDPEVGDTLKGATVVINGQVTGQYSNWSQTYNGLPSPEPNNQPNSDPNGEDYGHMHDAQSGDIAGTWNDYPLNYSDIKGYVVEYGGLENPPPPLQITGAATVTFDQAPQTSQWDFLTRDYNGDGATDIMAIKKNGTGTGTTEVHIMDGANNYKSWDLQTGTALGVTDNTWDFVKGDYNRDGATDILSIHKSGTGSGTTEVLILDAATNYSKCRKLKA